MSAKRLGISCPGLVAARHRVAMLQLATSSSSWTDTTSFETASRGWVRTSDALRHYQEQIESEWKSVMETSSPSPPAAAPKLASGSKLECPRVKLLCGGDVLISMADESLWTDEDLENIIGAFGVIVLERSSDNVKSLLTTIADNNRLAKFKSDIFVVPQTVVNNISSTAVRQIISSGSGLVWTFLLFIFVAPFLTLKPSFRHKERRRGTCFPTQCWTTFSNMSSTSPPRAGLALSRRPPTKTVSCKRLAPCSRLPCNGAAAALVGG